MFNIPILFIIFKRYDTTMKVFKEIQKIKPKKLYIAADAGRTSEEQMKCEETRSIIKNIDWECEIFTLFQQKNLGCKYGPYTAINWFFQHEEKGIILEDDCLPNNSFFLFIEEMLNKYRDDDRIGMIAGHNPINIKIPYSYTFSRFKGCWGWATWKRSWEKIDLELKQIDYAKHIVPLMVYNKKREKHWKQALKLIEGNKVAAWDWPWYFSLAAQNQLCIFPKKNLVANIGFGDDGTHCIGIAPENVLKTYDLEFPLKYPNCITPYLEFEYTFEQGLNMGTINIRSIMGKIFPKPIKRIIKKILKS